MIMFSLFPAIAFSENTVDIIVEGNTYVPYHYAGRREPVSGSEARVTALFISETIPATYRWRIGDIYLTSTEPTVKFNWPKLSREILVDVTVLDSSGNMLASASEYVQASSPKVLFYENNSLRGVSRQAVANSLNLIGSEVSVRVEPYFFNARTITSEATGTWRVKGLDTVAGPDWTSIVILRPESTELTEVDVSLDIRSRNNPIETVSGSFELKI